MDTTAVRNTFKEKFGAEGILYFSPGRVNLIGARWSTMLILQKPEENFF